MKQKEVCRQSGVLLHISSLPGRYGCGVFGEDARRFVDFLADNGFSYWQVLPFCMPDQYNSPYASYGAFSGNPYFIDPETLQQEGLITAEELLDAEEKNPYAAVFSRLKNERLPLLRRAASRVKDRSPIEKFLEDHPYIREFCAYMALKDKNPDTPWQSFKQLSYDEEDFFFHAFVQYTFVRQWLAVKEYAGSRGVKIIGDIPIYVALDSADVYFHKSLFQLKEDGYPAAVAGVPPDFFSEDGQLWGNPLYDWDAMQKDGFLWWRRRMEHMLTLFDGVRIDHFRGLESYFSVPATEKTARNGKWVKGPRRPFVKMLKEVAGDKLMIAEDLGVITPEVRSLVEYSGFSGMKILEFGFQRPLDPAHIPYSYPQNCVAYSGTHDNTTLLAYFFEIDPETRRHAFRYAGYEGDDVDVGVRAMIRSLFASPAKLVILPIQDVLGYGCDTRMNTPGRAEGNWSYRVTREQLQSVNHGFVRELNSMYGRTAEKKEKDA